MTLRITTPSTVAYEYSVIVLSVANKRLMLSVVLTYFNITNVRTNIKLTLFVIFPLSALSNFRCTCFKVSLHVRFCCAFHLKRPQTSIILPNEGKSPASFCHQVSISPTFYEQLFTPKSFRQKIKNPNCKHIKAV